MLTRDNADIKVSVQHGVLRVALLLILAGVLTVTQQRWVGYYTIYDHALAEKRLALHNAILHNEPPLGKTWREIGANRTNIRILAPYLAEGAHLATGIPVLKVYALLDTVTLFSIFLVLFAYLSAWLPPSFALVGLLYFAFVSTLTYHLHYFQPWDRLSLLCWLVGTILIRDNRLIALLVLLPIAITVKWDIIALPGLYWLAYWSRGSHRSVMLRTLALAGVSVVTVFVLTRAFPGGVEVLEAGTLSRNWSVLVALHLGYPPLLAFGLPLLLAAFGLGSAPRFLRASGLFAVALFVPLVLNSNFAEVRAHMMILVLLLPTALIGLARLVTVPEGGGRVTRPEEPESVLRP
jgi:hypothetical protein